MSAWRVVQVFERHSADSHVLEFFSIINVWSTERCRRFLQDLNFCSWIGHLWHCEAVNAPHLTPSSSSHSGKSATHESTTRCILSFEQSAIFTEKLWKSEVPKGLKVFLMLSCRAWRISYLPNVLFSKLDPLFSTIVKFTGNYVTTMFLFMTCALCARSIKLRSVAWNG